MKKILSTLFAATIIWTGSSFGQSTLYWYPGSAPNQGGTGSWNAATSFWSTTGGSTKTASPSLPGSGDSVVFGGTNGTVSMFSTNTGPQLNDWKVETDNYIFKAMDNAVTVSANSFSGAGLSTAIFESQGTKSVTYEIRGNTAFGGTIRDGQAVAGTQTVFKTGSGNWDLTAATLSYTGITYLNGGSLWVTTSQMSSLLTNRIFMGNAAGLGGNLVVVGGGTMNGALSTNIVLGATGGSFDGARAGFGARGGDLTVNLGGASAALQWGNPGFRAETFTLGTADSTHRVTMTNDIIAAQDGRILKVEDGASSIDAEMTGAFSTLSAGRILTKEGAGTLRLSGSTSSPLRLNQTAGTILIDGSWSSAADNSDYGIQIASGATLGGNGSVDLSSARLDVSGALMAGRGEANQSLTVDAEVNLLSDSKLVFGLAAATNDQLIRSGGTWTFQSNQEVQLIDGGASLTTYTLITGLDGLVDVSSWSLVDSGALDGTFSSDASNIYFTTSVIPEPSSALLLVVALGALGLRRQRMR